MSKKWLGLLVMYEMEVSFLICLVEEGKVENGNLGNLDKLRFKDWEVVKCFNYGKFFCVDILVRVNDKGIVVFEF